MFRRCQCSLSDSNSSAGFIASDLSSHITRSRSVGIPDPGGGSHHLPVQTLPFCRGLIVPLRWDPSEDAQF